MKNKIDSHDIQLTVYARKEGGRPYDLYAQKEVLQAIIDKQMFQPFGGLSVELRNPADKDWEEIFSNGDLATIKVNGRTKMTALINSVGYGSILQDNTVTNTLSIKAVDLGIMFSKFGKFITDPTWRVNSSSFGLNFFSAFQRIRNQYTYAKYDLKTIFRLTWTEMVGAFMKATSELGIPFTFSNGMTFDMAFLNTFDGVSDSFDNSYPLEIHILKENYPDVWQFWLKISNPPFTELFCDSVYKGQQIGQFGSKDFAVPTKDDFMVICRPNPWLGGRFEILKKRVNEIDPINFIQINATKSAAEVKSVYLVYPEGGANPASYRMSGDFAVDANLMSKWGVDFQEVPLSFLAYKENARDYAKGMADILKEGYANIDNYYSGASLMTYTDVRVGQAIKMPHKLGSKKQMYALVVGVTDQFKAPASMHTQITFVRGEIDKGVSL